MSNELIEYEELAQYSWADILDIIFEQVSIGEEELPEKVIQAVELLLSGEPRYKVAKQLGVSSRTIKNWIEKYPVIQSVLKDGYRLLSRWRMAQIESQFLDAVEISKEILTIPTGTDEVDPKILGIQAQQARYIIDKMLNPQIQQVIFNINKDKEEGGVYKAKIDALDYIRASATVDADFIENTDAPLFGVFSHIQVNDENQAMCHICGNYFENLKNHVEDEHEVSAEEYEIEHRLVFGALNKWQSKE